MIGKSGVFDEKGGLGDHEKTGASISRGEPVRLDKFTPETLLLSRLISLVTSGSPWFFVAS